MYYPPDGGYEGFKICRKCGECRDDCECREEARELRKQRKRQRKEKKGWNWTIDPDLLKDNHK